MFLLSFFFGCLGLSVEFSLKTDTGYPMDAELTLFTLVDPGTSLRFNTHWSAPPVSTLARSGGPGARQAEGLQPRSRRAPLAVRQSSYGLLIKNFQFSIFFLGFIQLCLS